MNNSSYQEWRNAKLKSYPQSADELFVEIGGLVGMSDAEIAAIKANCRRSNMAIYKCRDDFVDRAAVCAFASNFGLLRLDHHLCANEDGVSELSVASRGIRTGYVPYSSRSLSWHTDGYYNDPSRQVRAVVLRGIRTGYVPYSSRSLSWHTDGYYNDPSRQVRAVVLHCANSAASGGENALFDPEIAYIRLRDENPLYITALEHPECMTIPANTGTQGEIRPAVSGPVFSRDLRSCALHMRYSARKKNIQWRDDGTTRAARTGFPLPPASG